MIRFEDPGPQLTAGQRNALSLLVDGSRLVPTDVAEAVVLRVRGDDAAPDRLAPSEQIVVRDGAVEIAGGALTLITRIAGAVDEQRSIAADRHGRVPPSGNYLASRNLEREPIVSQFAVALRRAVTAAAGGRRPLALVAPWPEGRRWAMAMTHDLDVVAFWPVFTALRLAELAGKGRLADVAAVLGSALTDAARNPVWTAARRVLDTERRFGIRSTWFVITGTPTLDSMRAGDVTYSPESGAARRIIAAVRDAGHEVALHGSFETRESAERFAVQRARLERIAGAEVAGVRQHFLRMRPGVTHAAMRAAGFRYDSTYGFADRNGFRLGVADAAPAWNDTTESTLAIETVPFMWMDRALSKYRGVEDPAAWIEDALVIARACRDVDGVWNGIWHPNLSAPLGFPRVADAFTELCTRLMADSPWAATLDDIVRWRASRRGVRVVGIAPNGTMMARLEHDMVWPVSLEDAEDRTITFTRA